MNIICLYWVGDFRGRDFTPNDVVRLRQTIDKHIDRPYKFYCLTNDMTASLPAEKIELKHNWPGWWAKMELHRPDLPSGRTLYLDLDTHVINPLQPILDYPGDLVMFETRASKASKKSAPRNMVYQYQAATMLFDAGCETMTGLYDKFKKHWKLYMKKFRSDQDLMGAWIPNQPMFPKEWMLKLGTCAQLSKKPKDVIIVTGQGRVAIDGEKERKGDRLFRHLDAIPWLEKAARDTEGGTI